jgi:cytochrome b6-f complex iron-sulfur subunit
MKEKQKKVIAPNIKGTCQENSTEGGCPENKENNMGRRNFLITLGSGAVGIAAAGTVAGTYQYLIPNALLEPAMTFKAGSSSDYNEGVDSRWLDKQRVFIVRRKKSLYALVGICTHLGCIPPWQPSEGVFHCPCHGSKFSIEGDVLRGPAREPLYRAPIVVNPDGVARVGTGLLGIRLPQQANEDPERSSERFVIRV